MLGFFWAGPCRRKICSAVIGIVLIVFALPDSGWTYVDPGLTGMIYQIGFLVIAGISTFLALCGRRISAWLSRLPFRQVTDDRDDSR